MKKNNYGKCIENPINVDGVSAEMSFLNNLTSESDLPLFYHRLGSISSPLTKKPIDVYEVVTIQGQIGNLFGKDWDLLFFNIYHQGSPSMVPENYRIKSPQWKINQFIRNCDNPQDFQFLIEKNQGTNRRIQDFPNPLLKIALEGQGIYDEHLVFCEDHQHIDRINSIFFNSHFK